jgi:2-polyprenyl-3-methyl-5-hydroxy-6-metoxy-1,4-benzoquinol methylase
MGIRYETWYGGALKPPLRFSADVERAAGLASVKSICDIGGGANPMLDIEMAAAAGIERYVVLDVSAEELAKAPAGFEKVTADITRDSLEHLGSFDLIVSHAVAEHVTDPAAFHSAVYSLLAPGGRAMHFFPTFYDPVFLVNRLLPEVVSERILQRIQTNRARGGKHEKFPAYYRWCRGPARRQLRRLRGVGFEIDEYVGIFGHGYFHPMPPINRLGARLAEFLAHHPQPALTAYAWVTMSRPT